MMQHLQTIRNQLILKGDLRVKGLSEVQRHIIQMLEIPIGKPVLQLRGDLID